VRNEDTTVGSTLQGTKDTGTSGGTSKTDIKVSLEWTTWLITLRSLGELVLSISLLDTLKVLIETELLENTAGDEKTSGVGSSPVGKTVLDTVCLQLVGVCGDKDLVTGELRGDDLSNDVAVGETDDETVFWCIVLVLCLGDQTLACVVIGLSGTTALVLSLVTTEMIVSIPIAIEILSTRSSDIPVVRRVLDQLCERL